MLALDGLSAEQIVIAIYLEHNAHYHCTSTGHLWPCGVWERSSSISGWGELYSHGIVPRNWRVLTEDPTYGLV